MVKGAGKMYTTLPVLAEVYKLKSKNVLHYK